MAFRQKIILGLLLSVGTFCQGLTMVRSGLLYEFGMGFWGPNGHDGIWHLALVNQALKSFPPPNPIFAGLSLTNYHYFYDFLLSVVSRLTGISVPFLYFQVFPILLAFGIGFFSFLVGYFWRKDFWVGFWLAFFNYFAGSFGFLVTLWRERQMGGESLFWSMQSISTLLNPSFAFSVLVLLGGMLFLLRVEKWNLGKIFLGGFLFGILVGIKAYAGVGLAALGFFALIKFFKREKVYFWIFGLAILVSALVFLPLNRQAGSLFLFEPFWFIHSMIESPDRLYLSKIALARYFLLEQGIGPRLIIIEVMGLALFLVGNLGTRIIGAWDLLRRIKKLKEFDTFLIAGAVLSLAIPLFFVQKGTAWNTIQFFYYFLFFANFYAAATLSELTVSLKPLKVVVLILVVFLTVPTTISTFKGYLGWPPPAAISQAELEGLNFLKRKPEGVVLTFPYYNFEKNDYKTTPIPLKVYESTAYVSAFSGKTTFLEDEMNLQILGISWQQRKEEEMNFFSTDKKDWAKEFLSKNKICYLYLVGSQKMNLSEEKLGIQKIFENGEVRVYQTFLW